MANKEIILKNKVHETKNIFILKSDTKLWNFTRGPQDEFMIFRSTGHSIDKVVLH